MKVAEAGNVSADGSLRVWHPKEFKFSRTLKALTIRPKRNLSLRLRE
jgi:hypothetical protein